jgi:hypothetical protein
MLRDEESYEGFDYDDYDKEQRDKTIPVVECENPYEDYDLYDVEITETVTRKISVFAKDAKSAREYIESLNIDMQTNIDEYERSTTVADWCGSSDADYTVPLEWYGGEE